MKNILIIIIVVIVVGALGAGWYFLIGPGKTPATQTGTTTTGGSYGTLPQSTETSSTTPAGAASLPDYIGTASQVFGAVPTSTYLVLGTSQGSVQMNNFYLSNPPVVDGGSVVIKQTGNYIISFDKLGGAFWLGITGTPFNTWQNAAEQDFLATLGISQAQACKLKVTSGVIYSQGNPLDGESFPLSFCATGAFQKPQGN